MDNFIHLYFPLVIFKLWETLITPSEEQKSCKISHLLVLVIEPLIEAQSIDQQLDTIRIGMKSFWTEMAGLTKQIQGWVFILMILK